MGSPRRKLGFLAVLFVVCFFGAQAPAALADGLPALPIVDQTSAAISAATAPVQSDVSAAVAATAADASATVTPVVAATNDVVAATPAQPVATTVHAVTTPLVETATQLSQTVEPAVAAAREATPVATVEAAPVARETPRTTRSSAPQIRRVVHPATPRFDRPVSGKPRPAVRHSTLRVPAAAPARLAATPAHVVGGSALLLGDRLSGAGGTAAGSVPAAAAAAVPTVALTSFAPARPPAGATVFPPESLLGHGFTPLLVLERPD